MPRSQAEAAAECLVQADRLLARYATAKDLDPQYRSDRIDTLLDQRLRQKQRLKEAQ